MNLFGHHIGVFLFGYFLGCKCVLSEDILRYGIIIDAGSSGSRIHLYTYFVGGKYGDFHLVGDDLMKVKPGLSAFASDPTSAGASLAPLLTHAEKNVPPSSCPSTPIFLMATAGLRLTGAAVATEILRSVRKTLAGTPFLFHPHWAYVMSGGDEAVFGWLTVNFLLTKFTSRSLLSGVLDLGGGSIQFTHSELTGSQARLPAPSKRVMFGGEEYRLHATSYIGFGLDAVRDKVARALMQQKLDEGGPLEHPCLPTGYQTPNDVFVGKASFKDCEALYHHIFHDGCDNPPCSINPFPVSSLQEAIFGFSYFFDRTAAIGLLDGDFRMGGTQNMTVSDMRCAAEALCALGHLEMEARAVGCEDADKWMNFCGDVTYMIVLLEHGIGIDPAKMLTMGKTVNGVELVWTLGALIDYAATLQNPPSIYAEVLLPPTLRSTEI